MHSYKIYFSHGRDSGPEGSKIKYLTDAAKDLNLHTESIDYRATKDPDKRIELLTDKYDRSVKNIILYGSSMGAYVSLAASGTIKPKGIFLCAPALYLPGYKINEFPKLNIPVTIVHGYKDSVVSFKNTVKFAEKQACEIHIVDDDHILSESEEIISYLFNKFLRKVMRIN